jgi:hypothetical protein
MLYENFVWTTEITQEFNRVILDNYHCIDDIDSATLDFVKSKIKGKNGKRTTTSSTLWETRDSNGRTIGRSITNINT